MADQTSTRTSRGRTLLVIGSNPAITSGQRTIGRAELARQMLHFDHVELENLFSVSTYRTGGVSLAGTSECGWQEARPRLLAALDRADAVLMAYGLAKPSGAAALHFVQQVAWVQQQIAERGLPVWSVGGAPRHPSRWQRYTYREHPGVPFPEALRASLVIQETGTSERA
jgi:hypothetical protein